MTWVVMALLLVVSAVLQTQLPGVTLLSQAKAPILLCLSLYYALFRAPSAMLACAFVAGLLQDLLSPLPVGCSAACFCLVGAVISSFRGVLQSDSLVTQLFFGGATGMVMEATIFAVIERMGLVTCPWLWALVKILGTGLIAMLAAPLVCLAAGACDRLVGNVSGDAGLEEGAHGYI